MPIAARFHRYFEQDGGTTSFRFWSEPGLQTGCKTPRVKLVLDLPVGFHRCNVGPSFLRIENIYYVYITVSMSN